MLHVKKIVNEQNKRIVKRKENKAEMKGVSK
jgi:hypothetical protein